MSQQWHDFGINTKCIIKTLLKKMIQRSEQYKNCRFFISCYALSFITDKKLCSIVFTYKIKPTTSSVWPINDITEPIEWVSRYTHGVILLHIPVIVYYINMAWTLRYGRGNGGPCKHISFGGSHKTKSY